MKRSFHFNRNPDDLPEPWRAVPFREKFAALGHWSDQVLAAGDREPLEIAAAHELRALEAELEDRPADALIAHSQAWAAIVLRKRTA